MLCCVFEIPTFVLNLLLSGKQLFLTLCNFFYAVMEYAALGV